MDRTWKMGLLGAAILSVGLTGCVDEEPSLVMQGSIVPLGSVEITEETDDDTGDTTTSIETNCPFVEPEFDDPSGLIRTAGYINAEELGTRGQPRLDASTDDDDIRDALSGIPGRYIYQSVFENRLFDSRTVGGGGSGGDGGGFENLDQDQNDIMVQGATVEFELTDGTGLEFGSTRLSTIHVQSAGGSATLGVPIFETPQELTDLRDEVEAMGFTGSSLTVVANIQLFGRTLGSRDVESNTATYPIEICFQDCTRSTDPQCTAEESSTITL